jgi:ABC-type antimicrobial peptide transport system permease subunit
VIGVVATVEDEGDYPEAWYLPLAQDPTGPSTGRLHLMVRAADPLAHVAAIKAAAAAIDPSLPLYRVATMESLHSARIEKDRLGAMATALFAVAGALLAAIGIYAVLAFVLAGETREIGVRLALGATRAQIARHVVSRGVRLSGWGLMAGVPLAATLAFLLQRAIPEAQAVGTSIAAATLTVALTAALATAVPAARALRLSALDALRAD